MNDKGSDEFAVRDDTELLEKTIEAASGYTVVHIPESKEDAVVAIYKTGIDWMWALGLAAEHLAPFVLDRVLSPMNRLTMARLHEQSLRQVEAIVRRAVADSFANEYRADTQYVQDELNTFNDTNSQRHLENALDRSGLLIPRIASMGDESLGTLYVCVTQRLTALLAMREATTNGGYLRTARRLIREHGLHGTLGHGTNRLKQKQQDRVNRIVGCSCERHFEGPGEGHTYSCQRTDAAGRIVNYGRRDSLSDVRDQCRRDHDSHLAAEEGEFRRIESEIWAPWRNAMDQWESI